MENKGINWTSSKLKLWLFKSSTKEMRVTNERKYLQSIYPVKDLSREYISNSRNSQNKQFHCQNEQDISLKKIHTWQMNS
jgi:hypothetical protein